MCQSTWIRNGIEEYSLDVVPNLPTTPVLMFQLVGGHEAPLYWLATSDHLPPVIQLRWKSHRLIGAHQCGVLMVDVWMDGYYAKPTNYTSTGVPAITLRSIASAVAYCKQQSPFNNAPVMMTVASLIVSLKPQVFNLGWIQTQPVIQLSTISMPHWWAPIRVKQLSSSSS